MGNIQDSFGFFEENQANSGGGTVLEFVLSDSLVCLDNGGNYIFEGFFEESFNVVFGFFHFFLDDLSKP